MHKRSKHRCSIPGCKRRGKKLFAQNFQLAADIWVCNTHYNRHCSRDPFSIWEDVPCGFSPPLKIVLNKKKEDHHPPKGSRRGKDSRRALFTAWKDHTCPHPYRMVRWDLVYKVARCTQCGASVKRSKKNRDKYVSKKNQRNKPVLDAKYYSRKEITLGTAMNMFFFQRSIVDTTWEDAVSIARAIKPGTKFSASSFSWYRNHFIKRYMKRKEVTSMGRGDRKKKRGKKAKKKTTKKAVKKTTKKKKKVQTIQSIVLDYFDQVGPDEAKYEKTKARVLKVHPDSAFNKSHMGWYRSKWREINE